MKKIFKNGLSVLLALTIIYSSVIVGFSASGTSGSVCGEGDGTHSFGDWIVDYESNCWLYGFMYRVCSECEYVEEEYIKTINHSDDYGVIVLDDCLYTGDEVEPLIAVSYKGDMLEEGKDYNLSYTNNVNCGNSAKVTIRGLGEFSALNLTKNFNIFKRDIKEAYIEVDDCYYDTTQQKPDVEVYLYDKKLKLNEDYVLEYRNNVAAGTATVKVIGINNFYGYIEENFTISKDRTVTLNGKNETLFLGAGKLTFRLPFSGKVMFTGKIVDENSKVIKSYDSGGFVYASDYSFDFSSYGSSTKMGVFQLRYQCYAYDGGSCVGILPIMIYPTTTYPIRDFSLSVLEHEDFANSFVLAKADSELRDMGTITWYSSDRRIATVNNGTVNWLAPGTVRITATAKNISKSVELTREVVDISYNAQIITSEYFYGGSGILVACDGELLRENVDYTLEITDYGEYSVAKVTGKNLFKGSIFKKFYNDCGAPVICEHIFSEWNKIVDGGCDNDTINARFCINCGYIENEFISPKGHNTSDFIVEKTATCDEDGLKVKYCTVCDEVVVSQAIPAFGHSYSAWVVAVPVTCTENGREERTCSTCGDIQSEVIDARGYHKSSDWIIDSELSCTTDEVKHRECIDCGVVLEESVYKAQGQHNSGPWELVEEATCTTNGYSVKKCWTCGEEVERKIHYATGHDIGPWEVWQTANCKHDGVSYRTCEKCGEHVERRVIRKTKHKLSSWTTQASATVDAPGKKYRRCYTCTKVEFGVIPQLKCDKPKLGKVTNTATGIKFTWNKVSGADNYEIYRKTGSGSWKKIATVKGTVASYVDKNVKSGTTYKYTVKAKNEAGLSNYNTTGLSIKCISDPVLKTPVSTKSGITLKWNKITGAQGYVIYRKTGNGKLTKIATVKGVSKISYTDKSAKKGMKYTYQIKAYNGKIYSAYSNAKTIKDKY